MKILIIEKSPDIRSAIKKIIGFPSADYKIIESSDYDNAFFQLYSASPDLLIMDLECLNGRGLMLLKSAVALLPPSRIIIFTDLSAELIREKIVDAKLQYVFSKSTDTEQFIKTLSFIVSSSDNSEGSMVTVESQIPG